ncbi:hypothetical protein CCACVL1_01719 [Corchorus capsularis]|uniref:Uncharacterized protein n=1 Tax=Corchorus capsularis TaxID=210143 RepID=A0A1R3KG70_COCAP|nr:hypothetical protein CCACVL1_01719 [Corchorus capsularis]
MENAVSDGADGEESEDEDEESVEEGDEDDGFRGEEERGLLLKRVEKDGELGFECGEEELGENQLIDVNVNREGESKRDKEEDGERHEMESVGFEYAVGYVSNGPKIDL